MDEWIAIEQVYGPVGNGFANAHYVGASDGNEYLVKGPSFVKNFKHIGANERIGAALARRMNLRVPDYCVLALGNKLFFGSNRVSSSTFHPIIDDALFERCSNSDDVYELIVFDVWTCNTDRHEANLMVWCSAEKLPSRKSGECQAAEHFMVAIDHDQCFLSDNRDVTLFQSALIKTGVKEYVVLPVVRKSIISPLKLAEAIATAESISKDEITNIVSSVPSQLLPASDKDQWIDFIICRQGMLRSLFNGERNYFYFMNSGAI